MYTPFDFNEALSHRKEYIDDRLREGSPVIGLPWENGLLLLTVRRSQRKVYEIYDRQMFSAIGNQSDIENIRLSAIQMAHQEGFERSPDDVSSQRLVGFALSPALKKAYGDQLTVPFVVRALFAELGRIPSADTFITLNYDGEYEQHSDRAVVAGTAAAEDKMLERLGDLSERPSLNDALRAALSAWCVGARQVMKRAKDSHSEDDDYNPLRDIDEADADLVFLKDELKTGQLEVGILERRPNHETRFRLLNKEELDRVVQSVS